MCGVSATIEWADIPGRPYEASTLGDIRRKGGNILKPFVMPKGHLRVDLHVNNVREPWLVHRLVMLAFEGPCPDGLEVCHGDDVPGHNCRSNLEYGTKSKNLNDRVRNGIHHYSKRTHCAYGHPFESFNLVSSAKSRACLICSRARAEYRYYKGAHGTLAETMDRHYEKVMASA